MQRKLPIYDAVMPKVISGYDYAGILTCSIVDTPAIESDFLKFSIQDQLKTLKFSEDSDKRIITGALMIPDKLIYRRDETGYEFYVRHSAETIKEMTEHMMKSRSLYSFSLQHNGYTLEGWRATPMEVWIKEYEQDKSNSLGFDLPIGTLFMSVKVDDASIWDRIKEEEFKGFSIETVMNYKLSEDQQQQLFKKQEDMKLFYSKLEVGAEVLNVVDVDGVKTIEKFSGLVAVEDKAIKCEEGIIKEIYSQAEGEPKEEPKEEPAKQDFSEIKEIIKELISDQLESFKASIVEKIPESNAQEISELKIALQQYTSNQDENKAKEVAPNKEGNYEMAEKLYESYKAIKQLKNK